MIKANEDLRRQIAGDRPADEIFRVVVEATPNAIVLANAQGRILLVNAGAEKLFGYPRAELIGQPVEMLLPERFRGAHPGYRAEYAGHAEPRPMGQGRDLFALRKDGSEVPVEIGLNPIETPEGPLILSAIIDITERKRVEEAGARLAAIVEFSADAIIGKDLRSRVTSWNAGAERMFGYAAREMLGQPITRIIPADRQDDEEKIVTRIKRGESVEHFETQRLRQDGTLIDVSVAVSPIKDAAGHVIGASKVARDITEKKRTEEARRASEVRYRALFEHAPDGILIADSESHYLDANASMCRMLGYTREELIGRHASDIVVQTEVPHIGLALSTIKAGADYHREWQFRRKDGSVFGAEVIADAMPDGNLLAMVRDFTERRKAELAVATSEMRYRRLFETAKDGILILDAETGMVVDVNPFLVTTLGFSHEQFLGKAIWELGFFNDIWANAEKFAELKKKEYLRYENLPLKTMDGRKIEVEFVSNVYLVNGCKVIQCNIRDVSARVKAEEKIRELNTELEQRVIERTAQLEAANKELEAFSYSVSHDLRAPLRAIDGFSQATLEDFGPQLPEEGRYALQTIREGAQQMGALIDDLLTFSRLSRAPLNKQEVNTNTLVRLVIDSLGAQRKGRRIDLRLGELPACAGDPALLKQVWVNLLSNAFKYTRKRDPAVVEIGCEPAPEGDIYFVRDNGTGFDMRYAHKLFGVFQRLHRAEDYEGTGVGLALVQRIIQRHGGRVWAEAVVDQGATFYFTLETKNQI